MGWTGYTEYAGRRDWTPKRYWKEVYLPKIPDWYEAEPKRNEVLAENSHGNEFYAAVHDKKQNIVFGLVVLIKKDKEGIWVKEMDSSSGPYYYNASQKVLAALTPPVNNWDKEWREKCKEIRNTAKLTKTVKVDDILRFDISFDVKGKPINTLVIADTKKCLFHLPDETELIRFRNWKKYKFTIIGNV